MEWRNQILVGDAREKLRELPDSSVHCVVTSPPYYGLRQYFFDKAVVVRRDLSREKREAIEAELARRGIVPRSTDGSVSKG